MISLEKKQLVLIEHYQHNTSQRQIAKKLKMSRNTVKKYIEQDLTARQQDTRNLPVTDNYVTPPAYKKRNGKKVALTNMVMKRIRQMMKQNEQKRELNMPRPIIKLRPCGSIALPGFQLANSILVAFKLYLKLLI